MLRQLMAWLDHSARRPKSHQTSATPSLRTNLAAIAVLAPARVGGRTLPLAVTPGDVGRSGGPLGSMEGSRDSGWNRRDVSRVRAQIGRDASGSGGHRIARS